MIHSSAQWHNNHSKDTNFFNRFRMDIFSVVPFVGRTRVCCFLSSSCLLHRLCVCSKWVQIRVPSNEKCTTNIHVNQLAKVAQHEFNSLSITLLYIAPEALSGKQSICKIISTCLCQEFGIRLESHFTLHMFWDKLFLFIRFSSSLRLHYAEEILLKCNVH